MKLLRNFIKWFKSLFLSKEAKQFAKSAQAGYKREKSRQTRADTQEEINQDYFNRLPRRQGFIKTPSIAHKAYLKGLALEEELNPTEPKPKKVISPELKEKRELRLKKRMFFIELLAERARIIQLPFIKEKKRKKKLKAA